MKNKKTTLAIIGVIAVVLVTIGITYAYWLVTKTQTGTNTITAGCLDISLTGEKNDISLTNQFPLSDEEGMELAPYEFTVTNNCNTAVDYQVNLESIGTENDAIIADALKVVIGDKPILLGNKLEVESTISGAYASHMLTSGTLQASNSNNTDDSATYNLRLWIDADAPISEMNKTYRGKISVTVGQGINHAIEEGTLAYDVVSNYNGVDALESLNGTWKNSVTTTDYSYARATYKYYWATDYKLDSETGYYTLNGDIVQKTVAECRATEGLCGKYTFLETTNAESTTFRYIYEVSSFTNLSKTDTSTYNYITAKKISSINNFSERVTDGEGGLYTAQDDLGTSYYFRGDVDNNIVKFGKWSETLTDGIYGCLSDDGDSTNCRWADEEYTSIAECEENFAWYVENTGISGNCKQMYFGKENTDMYWRIVRINGDGTIRLIYDGNVKDETEDIGYSKVINPKQWDVKNEHRYAYKEGENIISTDNKTIVDEWYATNLEAEYGDYIADSIFCNDKSGEYEYIKDDYETGEEIPGTKDDYDHFNITFNGYKRWKIKTPSLICEQKEDRFTVESKKGNTLLTYPIGLITADELQFVGATINKDESDMFGTYLEDYRDSITTMTPTYIEDSYVGRMIELSPYNDEYLHGRIIRPVINLKMDVEFTGSGTLDDPYVIVTD